MLHFLAGLALLIFIGERVVHYVSAIRLRRAERRYLALLYPTPLPSPSAHPNSPLRPRYEPEQRKTDRLFLNAFTAALALASGVLFIYLFGAVPH
jgi:hypothetical protein